MAPTQRGKPDFLLLFLTFCIVGFGLVMIFSSSSAYSVYYHDTPLYYVQRQLIFAALGLLMMFVMMNIKTNLFQKSAVLVMLFSITLLIAVLLFGVEDKGAKRWLYIGKFGGQPVEFVKLGLVIYLATFLSKKEDRIRDFKTGIMPILVVLTILSILIMMQPHFSTIAIMVSVTFIMMYIAGIRFKHLVYIVLPIVSVVVVLIATEGYRLKRILGFLNPWEDPIGNGFQLIQSLYAFGHGGIQGVGFGQSIQKLHYLPEMHTDFIFPIIGEEFGFIGAVIFLSIYTIFILRGWLISMRSPVFFNQLLGIGVISIITVQGMINLGGVTGLIPITGVTLPLISYGGSSLLVCLMSIGILLSISRDNNRRKLLKESKT